MSEKRVQRAKPPVRAVSEYSERSTGPVDVTGSTRAVAAHVLSVYVLAASAGDVVLVSTAESRSVCRLHVHSCENDTECQSRESSESRVSEVKQLV